MKKILLIFFKIIIFTFVLLIFALGSFLIYRKIQLIYSNSKIYASQADKDLAFLIENMLKEIYTLKNKNIHNIKDCTLNNMSLSLEFNNLKYICYSPSIYNYSTKKSLENVGIYHKYANLYDIKKKEFGEASTLILFVKDNDEIIPLYTFYNFYDIDTKLKFLDIKNKTNCAKIANKKIILKIDSSLKDKALIKIECP